MMKKVKYIILIIIIISILVICGFYAHSNSKTEESTENVSETEVIKTDIVNSLSSSSYIKSGLEEKKELHATYYFKKIYFEENQKISAGEKIIKYTNGKYMTAPYDCVIIDSSIPDEEEVCTNQHYITIQSTDTLEVSLEIEENELDKLKVGQEVSVEIEALDNKNLTGYVTKISNTANYSSSGSTFTVTAQFQNDGEVLLGMSAKCSVILEKAENAIAVAKEAVKESNGTKYVTVRTENGQDKDVEITTGIENDAYIQVKSGLEEGDKVLIEQSEVQQNMQRNGEFHENFNNRR